MKTGNLLSKTQHVDPDNPRGHPFLKRVKGSHTAAYDPAVSFRSGEIEHGTGVRASWVMEPIKVLTPEEKKTGILLTPEELKRNKEIEDRNDLTKKRILLETVVPVQVANHYYVLCFATDLFDANLATEKPMEHLTPISLKVLNKILPREMSKTGFDVATYSREDHAKTVRVTATINGKEVSRVFPRHDIRSFFDRLKKRKPAEKRKRAVAEEEDNGEEEEEEGEGMELEEEPKPKPRAPKSHKKKEPVKREAPPALDASGGAFGISAEAAGRLNNTLKERGGSGQIYNIGFGNHGWLVLPTVMADMTAKVEPINLDVSPGGPFPGLKREIRPGGMAPLRAILLDEGRVTAALKYLADCALLPMKEWPSLSHDVFNTILAGIILGPNPELTASQVLGDIIKEFELERIVGPELWSRLLNDASFDEPKMAALERRFEELCIVQANGVTIAAKYAEVVSLGQTEMSATKKK